MRTVEVVDHNPLWQADFEAESQLIQAALSKTVVAIHHIGSTAIPGIYAKPIIDLLVEVQDIVHVDQHQAAMESLGYVSMGEFGIPGRRYFRKENQQGVRTHHVHAFAMGGSEVERHLAFRDYMRAHPEDAQAYSQLKRELAKQYPTEIELYMDGKDGFIKAMDKKAAKWQMMNQERPLPETIARIFAQFTEPNALFAALMPALGETLPCDRCFLYVRDPVQNRGVITHCWSRDGQAAEWIGADWLEDPTAPQDPLMTIALRTPVAVFVEDIETAGSDVVDRAYEREKFRHRALVHAPIYHSQALIGILECSMFDQPRAWTENDRQLIAYLQTELTTPTKVYIEQYQPF